MAMLDELEQLEGIARVVAGEVTGSHISRSNPQRRPLPAESLTARVAKRGGKVQLGELVELAWHYAQNEVWNVSNCRSAMVGDRFSLMLENQDGSQMLLTARVAAVGFEEFRLLKLR